jgi:flavorubredoxin
MHTGSTCEEIADGIYRLSTYLPDLAEPEGLTVNQFLVLADEPLLFHTGFRTLWPEVAGAISRVVPVACLRWVSFGHAEADECGAVNRLLGVAPRARVAFGSRGCDLALRDLVDGIVLPVAAGGALDLGGRRVRFLPTPHVPHNWESQVLYEETTRTLMCGDLFTQAGVRPALADDLVARTLETEARLQYATRGHVVPTTLRALAALEPRTLAVMHGASYSGDGAAELLALAAGWEDRFTHEDAEQGTSGHVCNA